MLRLKIKNGGEEPGIDLHVMSWHNNVTPIIAKVVMQLCSHVIGCYVIKIVGRLYM